MQGGEKADLLVGKGIQAHTAQILAFAGANGHGVLFYLTIPDHQQVGNALQGAFANLKAYFLVSQVTFDTETHISQLVDELSSGLCLMIGMFSGWASTQNADAEDDAAQAIDMVVIEEEWL